MPRPWRTSPILFCVVAIGLAAGAAGSLVTSAQGPFHPGGSSTTWGVLNSPWDGLLFLAPLGLGLGLLIYRRLRYGGLKIPVPLIVGILSVLVVLATFAVLGHYFAAPGPSTSNGASQPGGNGTTHHNSTSNHTSGGGGGSGGFTIPHVAYVFPDWLLLVAGAVVALAVAGLLIPALWARRRSPADAGGTDPRREAAQSALADARQALDEGGDPRTVIERLYGALMTRLSTFSGDLTMHTPEEIRREQLVPLGVRPDAANALTRLFEEARYSSHPLGPESAAHVRAAVSAAGADLERATAAR